MRGGALCLGCNWHKDSPARRVKPAFMRRHMAAVPMGSGTFYKAGDSMGSGAFCRAKSFCTGRRARIFFRQKSE